MGAGAGAASVRSAVSGPAGGARGRAADAQPVQAKLPPASEPTQHEFAGAHA
jgi:hypothetical protein